MSFALHAARRRGPSWGAVPTPTQLLEAQAAANATAIAALPQGGNDWKRARYGYMSGSIAADAAGLMGPAKQRNWLIDAVWPEYSGLDGFAARMAAVGTAGEPVAKSVYEAHRAPERVRCELTGFCVHPTETWLGSSPDLLIHEPKTPLHARSAAAPPSNPYWLAEPYVIEHADGPAAFVAAANGAAALPLMPTTASSVEYTTGTGEIKCIASAAQCFYSENPRHKRYGIPVQYYVQIQIECEVLGTEWNDFIVHLPGKTQVTRFYRNREYFQAELLPALRAAYFEMFLPQLEARASGKLTEPQTLYAGACVPTARVKRASKRKPEDGSEVKPATALAATDLDALMSFLKK